MNTNFPLIYALLDLPYYTLVQLSEYLLKGECSDRIRQYIQYHLDNYNKQYEENRVFFERYCRCELVNYLAAVYSTENITDALTSMKKKV